MNLPDATREKLRAVLLALLNAGGATQDDPADLDAALDGIEEIILQPQSVSPPFAPPRFRLPEDRAALSKTLVIQGKDGERCYDVILGYYPDGNLGEVFVRQEREGGTIGALLDAVATVISIALQYGVPWNVFAEKLAHQRFEPSGLTDDGDDDLKMVSSPLDYLARWVTRRARFPTGKEDDDAK